MKLLFLLLFAAMKVFLFYLLLAGLSAVLMNSSKASNNGSRRYEFPESFKYGAASSSYQIEGAWNESGKCPSIWDTFTHDHPELIADGSNGDVSADSYHFYRDDIAALKHVGVSAINCYLVIFYKTGLKFHHYRFSFSWPRILTNGTLLNEKGIDYYNNLIDALLENDIEPIVTVYHWDLPQYLQDLGGFTNPLIVDYFRHFCDVLFKNFGNRVRKWITFNEPFNVCVDGYATGNFAPGIKASGVGEYLCTHHVLQSHAASYHLYKEKYFEQQQGQIGICLNTKFVYPKDQTVDKELINKILQFGVKNFSMKIEIYFILSFSLVGMLMPFFHQTVDIRKS